MKTVKAILLLIAFYLPHFCFAWSQEGHRVCGEIASRHLTKKAQLSIASILGDESIAMASNWADFIKADSVYAYLSPWHYIDLPDSLNYVSLQSFLKTDTATDAYTKIKFLSAQLKNKQLAKDKKAMYLKLLIHIVEDIHQPLHTIGTEQGGNGIKVTWFNESSNLHKVWDGDVINFQQLSYTEYANWLDHAKPQQIKTWQQQPISQWLFDSYSIGENLVKEITQTNQKLSYLYNYNHIDTLNQQLLKGGIHLAKVLNDIFG